MCVFSLVPGSVLIFLFCFSLYCLVLSLINATLLKFAKYRLTKGYNVSARWHLLFFSWWCFQLYILLSILIVQFSDFLSIVSDLVVASNKSLINSPSRDQNVRKFLDSFQIWVAKLRNLDFKKYSQSKFISTDCPQYFLEAEKSLLKICWIEYFRRLYENFSQRFFLLLKCLLLELTYLRVQKLLQALLT